MNNNNNDIGFWIITALIVRSGHTPTTATVYRSNVSQAEAIEEMRRVVYRNDPEYKVVNITSMKVPRDHLFSAFMEESMTGMEPVKYVN